MPEWFDNKNIFFFIPFIRDFKKKAKKLTPIQTKLVPLSIKNTLRKLPIIKHLAFEIEITFYKYYETSK